MGTSAATNVSVISSADGNGRLLARGSNVMAISIWSSWLTLSDCPPPHRIDSASALSDFLLLYRSQFQRGARGSRIELQPHTTFGHLSVRHTSHRFLDPCGEITFYEMFSFAVAV